MADSKSDDSNTLAGIAKWLFVSTVVFYIPIHTLVQRPEARSIVLCDDATSAASFVWVDALFLFQPNNLVGKAEHIIDIENLRISCIEKVDSFGYLEAIPYPQFLYGDE